ncbi:nucleotide-binding domain-containing protein [Trichodelitschia bisporula]|uniref:Nucleotide-binding domain-containing protein n=1 Tax=Trichodelitschia bisporula TaxID=703511 RepID=A0A6G1HXM2_9PEZI|nr:nucleotide-binding domain-containing protein [Trichodelitschia bisporula]
MSTPRKRHVLIIGAGVTGLQTALALLDAGYTVHIMADHFHYDKNKPADYASPRAGAHWRSHAAPTDTEQQAWDKATYARWLAMLEDDGPASGLGLVSSHFYTPSPSPPWYAPHVQSFHLLPPRTTPDGQTLHGHAYTSVILNVPVYLKALDDRVTARGARFMRGGTPGLGTVRAHFAALYGPNAPVLAAVVNATGIGARGFVPDHAVYPLRGQTVIVRGSAERITTVDTPGVLTDLLYILPRPGAGVTVLGGTKGRDWDGSVDGETTREILERAAEWAPELGGVEGMEVLEVQVGLRPAREGGARVEVEWLREDLVIHAYGHAGAGYQNSVGSADKVVRLLGEALEKMERDRELDD